MDVNAPADLELSGDDSVVVAAAISNTDGTTTLVVDSSLFSFSVMVLHNVLSIIILRLKGD